MIPRMSSMYLSKHLASSQILGSNSDNQVFDYGGAGWEPIANPSIWHVSNLPTDFLTLQILH